MKRKIKVTQEDIDKGVPDDMTQCAVARALGRELAPDIYCQVDGATIELFEKPAGGLDRTVAEMDTPEEISDFIHRYDEVQGCKACRGEGWVADAAEFDGDRDCEACGGLGYVFPRGVDPVEFELDLPPGLTRES